MPIAQLGEALRHRGEREVARIAGVELVPRQGRRHASVRRRPHRVGARHGAILRVLVVVKEHALALFFPPLARRQAGCTPLDLARESERGSPHFVARPPPSARARASPARRTSSNVHARSMRTLTWIPREPDVFGQPTSAKSARVAWTTRATSRSWAQVT